MTRSIVAAIPPSGPSLPHTFERYAIRPEARRRPGRRWRRARPRRARSHSVRPHGRTRSGARSPGAGSLRGTAPPPHRRIREAPGAARSRSWNTSLRAPADRAGEDLRGCCPGPAPRRDPAVRIAGRPRRAPPEEGRRQQTAASGAIRSPTLLPGTRSDCLSTAFITQAGRGPAVAGTRGTGAPGRERRAHLDRGHGAPGVRIHPRRRRRDGLPPPWGTLCSPKTYRRRSGGVGLGRLAVADALLAVRVRRSGLEALGGAAAAAGPGAAWG